MAINWDLLDEDCSNISDWADDDAGSAVSEVSPAGQFRMDTNPTVMDIAARSRDIGSYPDTITFEIKLYHDNIGTLADTDFFYFTVSQAAEIFYAFFVAVRL